MRGGCVPVRAANQAVQVEAVLDALPSPTVLLAPDGTVLLANSAWSTRNAAVPDTRMGLGVGQNYFDAAVGFRDDPAPRMPLASLRALPGGGRESVAGDCAVPGGDGPRWFPLQASRVDEAGQIVPTHTDTPARVQAERPSAWRARH